MQALDGRTDDTAIHLLHEGLVRKRDRGYRTHTAGIQTHIALADPLIIFRYGQHLVILAIRQYKDRALDAIQELFDDHGLAGLAKHTAQHIAQLFLGLSQVVDDQYALTCCQTIRFQDVGSRQLLQEGITLCQVLGGDTLVTSRRDVMTHHERLGEILASLQLRTRFAGADHGDSGQRLILLEVIVDTFHQGILRADYDHLYLMRQHKRLDRIEIVCLHIDVGTY